MLKKNIITITTALVSLGILTTGCSTGNNSNNSSSTKQQETKVAKKTSSKSTNTQKSKSNQKELGKISTYGLPFGPSWIHIYENGKKTKATFDPNKNMTVKLHKYSIFQIGGSLPNIGETVYRKYRVSDSIEPATLDESSTSDYSKKLSLAGDNTTNGGLQVQFYKLDNIDSDVISKMAFSDLSKYLNAISTNDSSKLPNQSQALLNSMDEANNLRGSAANSYQVMEQYYNKRSAHTDGNNNDATESTYVSVGDDYFLDKKNITQLNVAIYAKVKKTDTDENAIRVDGLTPDYGSSHLYIDQFELTYLLTDDNKWQLANVENKGDSPYNMDTSGSNWITQKQN